MLLWRVSNHPDLTGVGGTLFEGRWHRKGQLVTYLAEHPALALLEHIVHLEIDPDDLPSTYKLSSVEVPAAVKIESLSEDDLDSIAAGWRSSTNACQKASDPWFASAPTVLLGVPSVVVPGRNYLLNPDHPDARQIT
jgi:RES domain-containing protein